MLQTALLAKNYWLGIARLALSWQARRILVNPFPKVSAHTPSQTDAGLAELVAQAVGRGHCIFPALLAVALEQVDLIGLRCERRRLHAQKSHRHTLFPILAKQRADLFENLRIELGGGWECMSPSQGCEIFIEIGR